VGASPTWTYGKSNSLIRKAKYKIIWYEIVISFTFMAHLSSHIPFKFNTQQHPFHLVKPSPWPYLVSLSVGITLFFFVFWMHNWINIKCFFLIAMAITGFPMFLFAIISWFWDIIREATFDGCHTLAVQRGLRIGFVLFIVSEIMFFFSFFWAFFHSSVSPSIWIGCVWPPLGIRPMNPWMLPLLNTLLSSGVTVTWAHLAMVHGLSSFVKGSTDLGSVTNQEIPSKVYPNGQKYYTEINLADRSTVGWALILTISLGIIFTFIQLYEYQSASFSINDGIYGSVFYLLTGFHGFHVLIGTLFLFVCYLRNWAHHFTHTRHIGFEMAIWYWHFVDVVWIFLFVFVYVWGG
jgi:cytochrome c oxidase subunit 3